MDSEGTEVIFQMTDHGEKTEAPTRKRLESARLEGRVALSTDLVGSFVLTSGFGFLLFFSGSIFAAIFSGTRASLGSIGSIRLDEQTSLQLLTGAVEHSLVILLPILMTLFAVAAVVTWLQVGLRIRIEEVLPDLQRVDPIRALMNIVGLGGLRRVGMGVLKLIAVGIVLVPGIWGLMGDSEVIRSAAVVAADGSLAAIGAKLVELILQACGALLVVSAVDWAYRRWVYERSLMMSRREVEDEKREMTGDPHLKRRRKQRHRQILAKRGPEFTDETLLHGGSTGDSR
jgi:flagellar biosynthetic protein FlhB